GSHRAAGRGLRGRPAHHHRGDGRRGAEEAGACHAAGRRRNGRRNGLLDQNRPPTSKDIREALDKRGFPVCFCLYTSIAVRYYLPRKSGYAIGYPTREAVPMSRGINRLSGADLRRSKPGLYGDGNNLFLQVSVSTTNHKQINRSWIFRYTTS